MRSESTPRPTQVDKNALKLEKNRESAKRARLRKKLYIKLLESQVERLKEVAKEGERIERESQKFLKMVARKEEVNDLMLDEVERYLSRDNLNDSKKVLPSPRRPSRNAKTPPPAWTNSWRKSARCRCAPPCATSANSAVRPSPSRPDQSGGDPAGGHPRAETGGGRRTAGNHQVSADGKRGTAEVSFSPWVGFTCRS